MKKILKAGRNCMGEFPVHKSGLLIDGRSYYRAFYRAARKARRYILIAGWQFDSNIALLRGDDVKEADGDVHLLPFLNSLCDRNPELAVNILAWDFSVIFSMDRELMQDWLFNWNTSGRIQFLFDDRHAVGASHHQKFAVIDGVAGFVGGMDICSNRWDNRRHLPDDPLRKNYSGKSYEQYHDIQSYHSGPVIDNLRKIFIIRWKHAGGADLSLPVVDDSDGFDISSPESIEAEKVSLCRTQSRTLFPPQEAVREIRSLYMDAIDAAEQLIYMENQYFSSQAVYKAMMDRMRASERSPLQIIMILPREPHSLLENVSLGIAQVRMLQSLKESALQCGHSLGIYYPAPLSREGLQSPTYIHSKLLLVDDRFLSIGSANTSNRSMGLDTELNVAWEADSDDQKQLAESIRRARVSLVGEHCGISDDNQLSRLRDIEGIVGFLNTLADDPEYQLQHHTMESFIDDIELLKDIKPEDLAIDPERPVIEENIYDLISRDRTGFFAEGISWLNEYLKANPLKSQVPMNETGKDGPDMHGNSFLLILYKAAYLLKSRWYIALFIVLASAFILLLILR